MNIVTAQLPWLTTLWTPVKHDWKISVNVSHESIKNLHVTITEQITTKPCFMELTSAYVAKESWVAIGKYRQISDIGLN